MLDRGFALAQIGMPPSDLLFGDSNLIRRGVLGVTLDRVGHLRGCADQVQRVHAHGVPGGLDLAAAPGCLEHTQLNLKLRRVAPERVERFLYALGVVPLRCGWKILDARQRCQRRALCGATRIFGCHRDYLQRVR